MLFCSSSKATRSVLAEKIKNRMDLLQAVEVQRQVEGLDGNDWVYSGQDSMETDTDRTHLPSGRLIPTEVAVNYNMEDYKECGGTAQHNVRSGHMH